jgi:dienelactone hydrolase
MRLLLLLLAVLLQPAAAWADEDPANPVLVPPAPIHEQVLHLSGDPDRPVDLIVTLFQPEGQGPFPLAVLNHGANGKREKPASMARQRYTFLAYYFLSRGYAVALPMMRGYGGSGGRQANYHCDLAALAMDNGRDIEAVIAGLATVPQIDASRVVVAGQSFGGWNTLGLGALQPRDVHGLINFVGGVQTSTCPDTQGGVSPSLVAAAERLGASTLLPGLWFYGENDSLFGPEIWRKLHDAYVSQGAQADLVDFGSFMDDSHQLLSHSESIPFWAPRVDAFLRRIGLPGREIAPQYLPMVPPPPSHFAALENVSAIPWGGASVAAAYRNFLSQPWTRAFVLSPAGQAANAHGGFDPLARALALCTRVHAGCVPYAVDNDVVFVPPPPVARPAVTRFAAIDDVAAVPWVNEKGRDAYRNFLAHPPPRAYVIGTGGENVSIEGAGGDPLQRAMAVCANAHVDCRPYAVDNDVVWVPPPPPRPPRPTGFAPIGDVAAVPWVSARARALYAHFLTVALPRAFVVAPGGQAAATQGGYDPLARALQKCAAAGLACRPYAVDDSVVWVRPR